MKIKESIDFSKRPLPDAEDKEGGQFWEGTRQGEIRFPKCNNCNQFHWYPAVLCPFCHSSDIEWQALTSQPRLYTWTFVQWNLAQTSYKDLFETQGPYIAALVEFDEAPGLYLPTNLFDCQPEEVHIGMPLEVIFQKVNDEITMPAFKPKRDKQS